MSKSHIMDLHPLVPAHVKIYIPVSSTKFHPLVKNNILIWIHYFNLLMRRCLHH